MKCLYCKTKNCAKEPGPAELPESSCSAAVAAEWLSCVLTSEEGACRSSQLYLRPRSTNICQQGNRRKNWALTLFSALSTKAHIVCLVLAPPPSNRGPKSISRTLRRCALAAETCLKNDLLSITLRLCLFGSCRCVYSKLCNSISTLHTQTLLGNQILSAKELDC